MFNIKSSLCCAAVALMLTMAAPMAKAAGMAPTGNFVSVRVNNAHVAYGVRAVTAARIAAVRPSSSTVTAATSRKKLNAIMLAA